MAHSKQSKKRIRQNEIRRLRNKSKSTTMRTLCKRVLQAVESGDQKTAQETLPSAIKGIDKAAKANVIHENTAARKKSRMERAVATMKV